MSSPAYDPHDPSHVAAMDIVLGLSKPDPRQHCHTAMRAYAGAWPYKADDPAHVSWYERLQGRGKPGPAPDDGCKPIDPADKLGKLRVMARLAVGIGAWMGPEASWRIPSKPSSGVNKVEPGVNTGVNTASSGVNKPVAGVNMGVNIQPTDEPGVNAGRGKHADAEAHKAKMREYMRKRRQDSKP